MTPPSRILLIRLSAIGDIVMASPLIAALRRAYPQAHIAWLVQAEGAPLLRHHPDLNQVILWSRAEWRALWRARRWGELWRGVRALRAELRRPGFDWVIDLQGLLKSGLPAGLTGARVRIGLGSREGSQWLMTRVVPRGGDPEEIGSEYRFLAEQLDLPLADFAMTLVPGAEDRAWARALIAREGLADGYVVCCPFTTRPQKHWFEDRWARLAVELHRAFGWRVLLLGGPGDTEAGARIQRLAAAERVVADGAEVAEGALPPREHGPGLINLAGATSLLQAAALIEASRLLIGVDTGLSHMGIAFGRPSLLLFGSTCPYRKTGRDNARVLYHHRPCSPCKRRPTCQGAFDCMRDITIAEVLAAARDLLEGSP
ncbi:MAG: glycosyltransferase family 9 protein [Chromatiaceae bacterium]|nr:glycosyltransferase family 9 protein [Chromatiaceae bacterium]